MQAYIDIDKFRFICNFKELFTEPFIHIYVKETRQEDNADYFNALQIVQSCDQGVFSREEVLIHLLVKMP